MKTPFLKNPLSIILLAILISLFGVMSLSFIGMIIYALLYDSHLFSNLSFYLSADYSQSSIVLFTKFIQIFQSVGLFILPPFVIAYFSRTNIFSGLSLNKYPRLYLLILAGLVMVFAMPLIDVMSEFNSKMVLPEALSWLEQWMRQSEENALEITKVFLNVSSVSGLFLNLFMIAIIPAIGEELMFRGFIQNFIAKRLNIHIAIFISAFIFSAIHMQFFGFLPRLAMGIFFGYLLYWSGSLWLPIFAHFVNNAVAVIITYKFGVENMSSESIVDDKTSYLYMVISSLFITASMVYTIYKFSDFNNIDKKKLTSSPQEKQV